MVSWFNQYADKETGEMESTGIMKFCEDIDVDPEDSVILILSYHMKAHKMMTYTEAEFIQGLNSLNCKNVKNLKAILPKLKRQLCEDFQTFSSVYKYTFDFAKNINGQKTIPKATAQALWKLLLVNKIWKLSSKWLLFLEKEQEDKRGINKDEWLQLLVFIDKHEFVDGKVVDFDENGAWPVLIDEFVEYLNKE